MLVLSRKVNQSIMIGDEIELMVIEIKGDTVKLGLKAPRNVPVYRQELYLEIKAENERASATANVAAASQLLKKALTKPLVPQETKKGSKE